MDLGLRGKRAIITGGTRGIGFRIAQNLAEEGCNLSICGRDPARLETALAALRKTGVTAHGAALNARDAEPLLAWLDDAVTALGGVDILILNVSGGGGVDSELNWKKNFDIDLMSAVRSCERITPALKKSDAGSIVFVGEVASVETGAEAAAYNAIKAGIVTHAAQLSQKLMRSGIRVNSVSPGPLLFPGSSWEMMRVMDAKRFRNVTSQHPGRRLGTDLEAANAITFIASPAASWVTGVNLVVDGGFTKRVQF